LASVPMEAIWRVELRFFPRSRMGAASVEAAADWMIFLRFIVGVGFSKDFFSYDFFPESLI